MSEHNGAALAVATEQRSSAPAVWTPSFAVAIDEAVERVSQKRRFFEEVMREGEDGHYGTIPGGSKKAVLFKSGAELLLANMGLQAELVDAESPVRDYSGAEHGGEPLIAYRRICRIYRQIGPSEPERMKVAQAEGFCTSRETKYRWREAKPECPECHGTFIFRSKFPDRDTGDQGYFCFKKVGGCGANFRSDDARITDQPTGRIPNPDVADLENTILKMADKRALVAATLIATGCSDIFTQDIEDAEGPSDGAPPSQRDEAKNVTPRNGATQQISNGNSQPPAEPATETVAKRLVREIYELKNIDPRRTDKQDHYILLCDVAQFHGFNAVPESWRDYTIEQLQAYIDCAKAKPPEDVPEDGADEDQREFDEAVPPREAAPAEPKISVVQRNAIESIVREKKIKTAQLSAIVKSATDGKKSTVDELSYEDGKKVLGALQAAGGR